MSERVSAVGDLTWPEVGARAAIGVILAVPVGSTEQHGRHLPLSTDTDIASALCQRLAARRADVLVAPALPYGSSGEHAGFPGTLSIGQEALELVVVELVRSATDTVRRVLFVNGHGGNAEPLMRAARRLRAESREVAVFSLDWGPRAHAAGDAHAGRVETSLQLALSPARVRLADAVRGPVRPVAELMPRLRAEGVAGVSPSGVLGDPGGASAAEGDSLLAQFTDQLLAAVEAWAGSSA